MNRAKLATAAARLMQMAAQTAGRAGRAAKRVPIDKARTVTHNPASKATSWGSAKAKAPIPHDTTGTPWTAVEGGPKPSWKDVLQHRLRDTGAVQTGKGGIYGARRAPGVSPSGGGARIPEGVQRGGVHPDVDPAFAPPLRGFANRPVRRATPEQLAGVRRAEWNARPLPRGSWGVPAAVGAGMALPLGAAAYARYGQPTPGSNFAHPLRAAAGTGMLPSDTATTPTESPMTKTNSDKSDAFRLGCYAAAKHAGATHDEAIQFVADLDRQAMEKRAWRLGVFKVAKTAGASDVDAVNFTNLMEKRAVSAAGAGQLVSKTLGGLTKGLGGMTARFGQGMLGAPVRNMGAAETKGLRAIDKLKPGKQPLPKGSPKGTKAPVLQRADIKAQRAAHLQGLTDQGFAVPNARGKTPELATGWGASAVKGMHENQGLTGAAVGAGGLYGAGKLLGGGGAAAPAPAAAGADGGPATMEQLQAQLDRLERLQGFGGRRRRHYDDDYGY